MTYGRKNEHKKKAISKKGSTYFRVTGKSMRRKSGMNKEIRNKD